MNIANLKSEFFLDPEITFLNHGSFGACPRPVIETYQNWQKCLERQPVRFLGRELNDLYLQARRVLGSYLHAAADDLVFVPNATHGVNIIARSLPLKEEDEILASNHEYGACDYAWEFVCRKAGAIYHRQPVTLPASSPEEIVEQIWQGVSPHTRLIFISQITSPTAVRLPVEAICRQARQAGILTLVDGAHAPGQLSLDLEALGADFYTGNCHKWMLSPRGAGFLYARREVQALIEPLVVSWGFHPTPANTTGSDFVDALQWTGTHDPAAVLSVPAAIRFMEENQWDLIRRHCNGLLREGLQRISDLTGLPPLYLAEFSQPNGDETSFSLLPPQMGAALLPAGWDPSTVKQRLYDEFRIEIPVTEWNGRNLLRLSVQAYNTPADLDALVEAMESIQTS